MNRTPATIALWVLQAALAVLFVVNFGPRLSGVAALGLTGVMAGAVLAEVVLLDADVLVPLILLIAVAVIAWFRRADTLALIRRFRRTGSPTGHIGRSDGTPSRS